VPLLPLACLVFFFSNISDNVTKLTHLSWILAQFFSWIEKHCTDLSWIMTQLSSLLMNSSN